jgi:hypothetical protein
VECDVQWTFREDDAKLGRVFGDRGSSGCIVVASGGFRFAGAEDRRDSLLGLDWSPHGASSIARHRMSRLTLRAVAPAADKTY